VDATLATAEVATAAAKAEGAGDTAPNVIAAAKPEAVEVIPRLASKARNFSKARSTRIRAAFGDVLNFL